MQVRIKTLIIVLLLAVPAMAGQRTRGDWLARYTIDGKLPVAGWVFDGRAMDITDNANDGTFVNGATFVQEGIGVGSVSLDGSNDKVATTKVWDIDFSTDDCSVSAWIKRDQFDAEDTIFWTTSSAHLGIDAANLLVWNNYDGGNNNYPSTGIITNGQWVFVAVVVDSQIAIYIDGKLDSAVTKNENALNPSAVTYLGWVVDGWGWNTDGSLDDVIFWHSALAAADVKQLYAIGKAEMLP